MTLDQSKAFRRLAELDADDLEHHIAESLNDRELSTARALGLWEQFVKPRKREEACERRRAIRQRLDHVRSGDMSLPAPGVQSQAA